MKTFYLTNKGPVSRKIYEILVGYGNFLFGTNSTWSTQGKDEISNKRKAVVFYSNKRQSTDKNHTLFLCQKSLEHE